MDQCEKYCTNNQSIYTTETSFISNKKNKINLKGLDKHQF